MGEIVKLIKDWFQAKGDTLRLAKAIADLITETVWPVIRDITVERSEYGWSVRFYSDSREVRRTCNDIEFWEILYEVFPELEIVVSGYFYLTPDEAEEIHKRLKALREA